MKKPSIFTILIALLLSVAFPVSQLVYAQDSFPAIFMPLMGNVGTEGTPPPPPTQWTQSDKTAIHDIVTRSGELGIREADKHIKTPVVITTTINSEDYWVGAENNYVVQNSPDLLYLGANDDIIWPGALIKGNQAHDFVYTPITLPRAPLMLSVNLENVACAGELTHQVNDPNLSNIREGIRLLLQEARQDCTIIAAQADWNKEVVYNEEHVNLAIGANVDYSSINLHTKFSWNSDTYKTKIIASYKQVFYEVNINTPVTQADFFDPARNSVAQIDAAMPVGTDPMYVAGVKYGMMALMFFESSYSNEELNTAIDIAYSGQPLSTTITGTLTAQQVFNKSNIRIVVYGGGTAGLSTIYDGINGFYTVINASASGGPDSPGVPLVYKFRNFSDNNLAMITFSTNYNIAGPNRFPVYPRIRVLLDQFVLIDAYSEDWPFECRLEMREMSIYVYASNCNSSGVCPIFVNAHRLGYKQDMDYLMGIGWTYDPGDGAYVDITFDNRKDPYNINVAKLGIKGVAHEFDIWPDPHDHAEDSHEYAGWNSIMEGALPNALNRPQRTVTYRFNDGGNFTFDYTFIITFLNP